MELKVLLKTSRSITLEIENNECFFSGQNYDVYLNDMRIIENEHKNVFSLFNLTPDTEYLVKVIFKKEILSVNVHTEFEFVTLNVRKFGAIGNGMTDDTNSIQAAIMSCPKDGVVYFPKGTYYCKPLFLKSDLTLYLDEEATLLGNIDRKNYSILPGLTESVDEKDEYYLGVYEGNPLDVFASLITGINVDNVKIIGKGTLNGNATSTDWWKEPKKKIISRRPNLIYLNHCENIIVQGIKVTNSPCWNIHPYASNHLKFYDLRIENPADSPNTDGLDPESCSDVEIIGIDFSVGDDCIAIKSGKLYLGKKTKLPSKDIIIRNCHMKYGHGAVVIGSEISGGARNIKVEKCLFTETDRGLRIKTRRGRGQDSIIDEIVFENIKMNGVLTPIVVNMFYFCDPDGKSEYVWSKEKLPVDDWTPYIGKMSFTDIECLNTHLAASYFYGLPEQKIKEINLKNIYVEFSSNALSGKPAMMDHINDVSKIGIYANNVEKLSLDNVNIVGCSQERYELKNIDNLEIKHKK